LLQVAFKNTLVHSANWINFTQKISNPQYISGLLILWSFEVIAGKSMSNFSRSKNSEY
jgi:hypothetical protein